MVIRAAKTKYGPRSIWRAWEYAQRAILTLHRGLPPRNVDRSKLTRDVNDWLMTNSDFRATGQPQISRNVILRVLDFLRRRQSS
jgi:hypothetical protein